MKYILKHYENEMFFEITSVEESNNRSYRVINICYSPALSYDDADKLARCLLAILNDNSINEVVNNE